MADSSPGSAVGYRDDAVIASLLHGRSLHLQRRDPAAERAMLATLAQFLADDPEVLLERVAEAVRQLCGADSVVVAARETGPDGDEICWKAAAGGLACQMGKRWPIRACPAGASVLADGAVLFLRPGAEFESIRDSGVPAGEALGVPWRVRGHPAGSLVAMLDGDDQHFDAHDLQLLRELAGFAAAAHQASGALHDPDPERLEREVEQRLRPVLESKESLEREVEESRAAERALREHKALIDATLSISTVGVIYFDLDGTVRDVNQAYQRMTGYGEDELREADNWKRITAPEFWELTLRSGQELRETGLTRPYTKQMVRRDGSRWWGLYAPARISGEGANARCVCFILDVTEQKETESRLAESEERFRALVEGFGQAVWETDAEANFIEPSPSWCAYTGQREAASMGKGWLDAVHPDDRDYVQREWRAALAMRRGINMEFRVHVAMGGWRWTDVRAAPLFNPDRSLRKWFGMNIDIDERRRTQAALAESERRYRLLFEAMDEGFLLATVQFDEHGRAVGLAYSEANPAAVRLTSIQYVGPGQLKVRAEHEPCWLEACAQVARTGVSTRSQCFTNPTGSWFDFFVYPVGGDSAAPRVAILFHDITVRKRAEDALRESEARFRALADASPALIYQFDPDGSLMYLNQRSPGDETLAPSNGWPAAVQPDDMSAYLDEVSDGIRQRAAFNQRIRVPAHDGSWRWFESHAAPWYSGDGQHRGYVGISLDITGAVQAEEALKEADRRKDEFLATLAHELRNPLAPISNAVQLMRRPDGRRQSDRVVEMVGRQVRQIVTLVDDLMEVSRITRGKIDLRLERVPVAEIVHSAVETSQLAIERAGHQLAVALPEEPLVLLADRVRLTQVFANLLNNAAKYTDAGGRIWVDVRHVDGAVAVSVRDTGIGIPEESLGRVFDMFAQAHRAVGRGQGGLGIGLTMVRSLVEMHHGTVEAHSAGPGQGSEFVVRLPLAQPDDAWLERPGQAQARPNAPFAGQRIMVVDDNRDAADTLGLLLEADGADVRVVYDGRAALAMAESFMPTSVMLDIGMPGMDGYEVARRLRQDERFASMRIVALTGWGQDSDRRQTRNRGFTHHLTKPVSLEDLYKILT